MKVMVSLTINLESKSATMRSSARCCSALPNDHIATAAPRRGSSG